MPLIGFGAAIALLSRTQLAINIGLFLAGALLGFRCHSLFTTAMAFVPNAADHLFLAGPISLIAAGLLLIVPSFIRHWFAPVAALIVGAMLAQMISLTDPTIDNWNVSLAGVGLGLWVIVTTSLCVRSFYQDWFPIGARIVGSWFLAIGLLYGGAAFAVRPMLPSLHDEKLMTPPPANALPDVSTDPSGPSPEELPAQP
ncbi:hypothetical protein [Hyphomicrobium sp. 802]|uniref:hypothetical protein n=1 Tax=Hyphomicrobium sp. 802 TaxID=1112272 RepID=UPI001AEC5495|nr:hypothetical protein [Hyphomicrobium sp. 802]